MKRWRGCNSTVRRYRTVEIKSNRKQKGTDVADMQGIFRIIQSVPSPKAESFKMWLAEVGKERIDEIIDPELTISDLVDIIHRWFTLGLYRYFEISSHRKTKKFNETNFLY